MNPPAAVDELDPQRIRNALPDRERAAFMHEYQQAATSAAGDPARYRELRELLYVWHLKTIACNKPGYYQRRAEAADPASTAFVPAAEVTPELETRLQGRG